MPTPTPKPTPTPTPTPRPTPTPAPTTGPYKGVAATIPGNVYATNYDLGGQGVGYEDSVGANPGVYRTDGVDIKATSDAQTGTGYVLGWRTGGEWTKYTVTVAKAAQYSLTARVESDSSTGAFHVSVDGVTVSSATVPLTGPWDTGSSWEKLNLGAVTLTAGTHVVTVSADSQWFDLNYLTFTAPAPTPTPTPIPAPTILYASNYNTGGQGVGYEDSIGANPGVGRTAGVDLKVTSDTPAGSGFVLGWRTAGEWTKYSITTQASQYNLTARVESGSSTGAFHVSVDGVTVASTAVPLTGPWDTASSWQTLNLGTVTLTAGSHLIEVSVDSQWFDLNYLTFTEL